MCWHTHAACVLCSAMEKHVSGVRKAVASTRWQITSDTFYLEVPHTAPLATQHRHRHLQMGPCSVEAQAALGFRYAHHPGAQ